MKKNYLNMKRWLFALLLLCSAGVAMAQTTEPEKTTDKVTISEVQLSPGGNEGHFTISLESSRRYSTLGFDIFLPDGYEFVYYEDSYYDEDLDEDITVYQPKVFKATSTIFKADHTVSSNVQSTGALRITALSGNSSAMTANSGPLVDVYVRATPYVKQGGADVSINSCFFVTTKAVQYNAEDQTISDKLSASGNCSLPFSITAAKKWSTRVFPFSMTEIPEGLSVYTYNSQDKENVYLAKQNSIEAYTPYIISTEKDMNITLTGTASAEEYTSHVKSNGTCGSDALKGAVKNQTVHRGYILQSQDGGECKFYPILDNEKFSIPTGKCWIDASVAGTKELKFIISDDADGIEATQLQAEAPEAIYDLQGRRTRASLHGIYIIDGKKVIK